jgi:steroid delta-isomerase
MRSLAERSQCEDDHIPHFKGARLRKTRFDTKSFLRTTRMISSTPQHIRAIFTAYTDCHSAGDVDGIVALFALDAVIRDPANGPEQRGRAALHSFFTAGIAASGGPVDMKLEGAVRIAGNQGAAALVVRTISGSPVYRVETLDVMTFGPDGLITEMVAYWGPESFRLEETQS